MLLTSCVVLALADARLSLIPFTILFVGGTLIAILASVTAEMVADLHGAAPEVVGATLIATVALSSMAAGLMLWLVGRLRGGGIARYVPFQVMAGVLAASGWALSIGGARVAMGRGIDLALLSDLFPLLHGFGGTQQSAIGAVEDGVGGGNPFGVRRQRVAAGVNPPRP